MRCVCCLISNEFQFDGVSIEFDLKEKVHWRVYLSLLAKCISAIYLGRYVCVLRVSHDICVYVSAYVRVFARFRQQFPALKALELDVILLTNIYHILEPLEFYSNQDYSNTFSTHWCKKLHSDIGLLCIHVKTWYYSWYKIFNRTKVL